MVGLELEHILYALIIATAAYVVREIRRRRYELRPRNPAMTIQEAWRRWEAGIRKHPDRRFAGDLLNPASVPASLREHARRRVEEMARLAASAEEHERQAVRRMILSQATLELLLDALARSDEPSRQTLIHGYQPGMDQALTQAALASRLMWLVLREYARWKFDDAVADDWFHHYRGLAGPYIREKVRLARSYILEADPAAGRFVEIYDSLLAELRGQALKARPKKRFPPADLES